MKKGRCSVDCKGKKLKDLCNQCVCVSRSTKRKIQNVTWLHNIIAKIFIYLWKPILCTDRDSFCGFEVFYKQCKTVHTRRDEIERDGIQKK